MWTEEKGIPFPFLTLLNILGVSIKLGEVAVSPWKAKDTPERTAGLFNV